MAEESRFRVRWQTHYANIPDHLITTPELTRNERLTWCVLASMAGADPTAWPKQSTLATALAEQDDDGNLRQPDIRTVRRWLARLEAKGWMIVHRTGRNNEYELIEKCASQRPQYRTPGSAIESNSGSYDPIRSDSGVRSDRTPESDHHVKGINHPKEPTLTNHHHDDDGQPVSADADAAGEPSPPVSAPPPAPVVRLLADHGVICAAEFAHLDYAAVKQRIERMPQAAPGAIVKSLREYPPAPVPPGQPPPAGWQQHPAADDQRPDWIEAERWQALNDNLRWILAAASLADDGRLQFASPQQMQAATLPVIHTQLETLLESLELEAHDDSR